MPQLKIYRDNKTGKVFHDSCFEEDESRVGFTEITSNDVEDDEDCESCAGSILEAPDEDDDEVDDDDEVEA